MWVTALTSLCGCWVIVCLWRALQAVHRSVVVRRGEKSTQRQQHYEHYRQQVANHGFLRSSYMGGAVVYIAALTYVQATSKGQLHTGQITGLVLAYCVAAFVVWSTVMVLVPFWAGVLAEWSHILSLLTFAVYALYCNFAPSLGIMHSVNNMERVLSYNLFWLLEDVPLSTYQSSLGAMTMLHLVSHAGHTPQLLKDPSQLLLTAALYVGLGFVVPQLTHWTVQYALKPSKLPAPIFRTVCMVANVMSVTDLILRIPSLTHRLQDSLRAAAAGDDGMAVLAETVRWLLPEPGQGQAYVYGLAPALTLSCSTVLLLATLASCVVLTLCEEPVPASEAVDHPRHEQDQLVRWLSQIEAMQHLLAFMRTLPMSHRYVLCGILGLGSMQVVGLGALMVGMVLLPSETLLRRVPAILVSVLLGLVLQVAGVAHLVGPPKAQRTTLTGPSKPQSPTRLQLDARGVTDSQTIDDSGTLWQPSGDSTATNDRPTVGEGSFGLDGQAVSDQPQEFVTRLEALAHYKAFMQGLDAQPDSYTMDDFVDGSANAMKGVFPQVHHSSFCLLNAAGNSVNMYTFLGQGSRQSPRMNVAVAPSTLIYHVLNNCRPVFISNISTFPGPFSDVQFMRFVLGLKSVACLPLVSSQGRVLGVLRLGFQEPWEWTDPEKSIAKQVAFILSSGRNMDGAAAGPMFMPQEQGSQQAEAPLQGPGLGVFEQGDSRRQGSQSMSHGPTENQRSQVPASGASQGGIGGSMNHGMGGPGISNSRGQFPGQVPLRSNSTAFDLGSNSHNFAAPSWGTSVPMLNRPMAAGGSSLSVKGGGVPFASPMSSSASQHVGQVLGPPHRGPPHLHAGGVAGFSTMGTVRSTGGNGRSVPGWPTAGPGSTSNSVRSGYQHHPSQGGGGGSVASLNPAALGVMEQAAGPQFRSPGHQQDRWEAGSYQSNASGSTVQGGTSMMRRTGTGRRRPPSSQHMPGGQMDSHSVDPFDEGGPGGEGATSDLKMLEVIGRGGFGSVYKAQWRGRTVAVKVLEHGDEFLGCATDGGSDGPDGNSARGGKESVDRKMDLSGRRAALLEGAMTSTINHPNVVATYDYRVVHLTPQPSKGLGASSRISQETHIVMEWCDKGSLQDAMEKGFFMIDNPEGAKTIDMESLCMTLSEVASAMAYLHTHRITHRDLKPKNVLLKTSQKDRRGFAAKVSDFGLSQVLPDTNRTQVSKNYSGTVTHMPPELIEDGKVYPQGDVYAFGIMMWEAFTGSTPYAHMAHPQIMVAVVTHNLRPRFPDTCPAWYKALAYKCWAKDPKARPTFASVTDVLMAQVRDGAWEAVTSTDDGRS